MFTAWTLRSSGALKTLSSLSYKHVVPPGRREVSRLVAITIALSFIATLLPVASVWANQSSTMPCCVGKTAGHCESGIAAKKIPPPDPEPMCGLHNAPAADDEITIVAEPSHADSQHLSEFSSSRPAAEPLSVSQLCQMECSACAATSVRQQKRERTIVQATSHQISPLTLHSKFEILPSSFSSNEDWEQISPRGPPAELR
jgi:hypothetical protein